MSGLRPGNLPAGEMFRSPPPKTAEDPPAGAEGTQPQALRVDLTEDDPTAEADTASALRGKIRGIQMTAGKMKTFISNNSNVHKEMKRLTEALFLEVQSAERTARHLDSGTGKAQIAETAGLREKLDTATREIADLREKLDTASRELSGCTCRRERQRLLDEAEAVERSIEGCTPETFEGLLKMAWPEGAYKHSTVSEGSILEERPLRLALITEGSPADEDTWSQLAAQFPSLRGQPGQEVGAVLAARVTPELTVVGRQTESQPTTTLIAARLPRAGTPLQVMEVIDLAVSTAKDNRCQKEERIVCHAPADWEETGVRRMLECAARKHEVHLKIMETHRGRRHGSTLATRTITIKRGPDVSYADLLRGMQATVDPGRLGVEIKGTACSQNGDLRVRIAERTAGASAGFLEALTTGAGVEASLDPGRQTRFLIRNVWEGLTAEEIRAAIVGAGLTTAPFTVEEPRRGASGRWTALLKVEPVDAQGLRRRDRLSIGWAACPISEWTDVPCCRRCQRMGHHESSCAFEAVEQRRCHRCGTLGHVAKECTAHPKCYNCEEEGHAANSATCPAFRRALAAARQRPQRVTRPTPHVEVEPAIAPPAQETPSHRVGPKRVTIVDEEGFSLSTRKRMASPPTGNPPKACNTNNAV